MQQNLELLKNLQGLDQQMNEIRHDRQKLETETAALKADLERIQGMADSLTDELGRLTAERKELSQALVQEQENIKKAEGRLPAIKTQKEYVAVLKEIDTAKKLNRDLQEKIEAKDREIEALSRDHGEKEAARAELAGKAAARQAEIDARLGEFDQQLGVRGKEREELLSQLPLATRKRYQLLMERRGGVAVVEARQGACLGCNMHLPPQLYNSLFRGQEVQSCPHCSRLLFIAADKEHEAH